MSDTTAFALTVHQLRFTCVAQTPVEFGPQAGAQLRGALWTTLEEVARYTSDEPLHYLLALERDSARGENPTRPLAIRPPLGARAEHKQRYAPGERWSFGMTLFGDAARYFPYVCLAVHRMGIGGVGYNRGRYTIENIEAVNELTGEAQRLLSDEGQVSSPGLPIQASQVQAFAADLPTEALTLRFLTPTQIKSGGRILNTPDFAAIIGRLLERCQALDHHYNPQPAARDWWEAQHHASMAVAASVRVERDDTRWVNVYSGSRRTNSRTNIGGLVGTVTFAGDLEPFRLWLTWGQLLHVGKNTIKGDGWYCILRV